MSEPPHSAIYFGDARDFWWNPDFVELMARRLELPRFRRVLDLGTGYGHFARVWLPHLAPGARLTGVDPEERSLAEAERRNRAFASARGLDVALEYAVGHAEALPFPDGAFDLVLAQTVLIHVADVDRALDEIARVLAPGGRVFLAEPNNLPGTVAELVERETLDPAELLDLFELELRIQLGKRALGLGFNSFGGPLARHLGPPRFENLRGWLSDRAVALTPPYSTPGEAADVAELREFHEKGWVGRPTEEAERFYLAGGGRRQRFAELWRRALARQAALVAAIDAKTHRGAGGGVFHLYAADRPGELRSRP